MNLPGSVQRAIKESKGGLTAFAMEYGHNYQTLATKLNPNDRKSWLNLVELEEVIEYTQDTRILDAICRLFGVTWQSLDLAGEDHKTLFKQFVKEATEAINAAVQYDDAAMNVREHTEVLKELAEAREAINKLIAHHEAALEHAVPRRVG